jgi:hypothetical protein
VTFSGIDCLTTAAFRGNVAGDQLVGSATEGDVRVGFEVDASDAERGDQSSLVGTFRIETGAACTLPFRATFSATPAP